MAFEPPMGEDGKYDRKITCPVCEGTCYVWVENNREWRWVLFIPVRDIRDYVLKKCKGCKGKGVI